MSDDVKYVWFDVDGNLYDEEPDRFQRKHYGPFARYRLESDPEQVLVEPTKPYAVVEVDGAFENEGERVRVVRSFFNTSSLPQHWVELVDGSLLDDSQKFYVWTWDILSERNPKIIFEGADL